MGKRGGFLSAVKKIFSCESSQNREKKNRKPGKWSEKQGIIDSDSSIADNEVVVVSATHPQSEDVKLAEAENEQNRHAYSVAIATAAAAEAAVAAAHAAAEVVRLTSAACTSTKTKEEIAAVKIQTAFRGYTARRALRALRGLVRLKTLVGGQAAKHQAGTTLKIMQTHSRLQFEVRAMRNRMSVENTAMQRQIHQKHEKELEKLRASIGENWDDSTQSKEQIEANIQHRVEAAERRERALAYAYSHQQTWRNPSNNSTNQTFMDPNIPRWGWSWLERWMATRPWENGIPIDKEPSSLKTTKMVMQQHSPSARRQSCGPPSRQSPSTPNSKASSRLKPPSPRDDDSKSINSAQSDRCRRHSIAGSSVRDDESLASSPAIGGQGYMASTESARARSRLASPLGVEKNGTPEKGGGGGGGSAKKRLSFSGSGPGSRRHSGPPKIDFSSVVKDIETEP